jgi:hypothetical protein
MSWLDQALREGQRAGLGLLGTTLISAAGAHTGHWWCVVPLADATFTTLTDALRDGDTFVGQTFPKGVPIPGDFSVIDLATGSCLAYKYPKGDGAAA